MGPRTRARVVGTAGQLRRNSDLARVAWESWTTPQNHAPDQESPGIAGRPHGTSKQGLSHPEELVDPAGPWVRARVTRDSCSTPRALGPEWESPGQAGQHRGNSDPGPRRPVQLVDNAGTWTLARVALVRWSTLRSLGPGPESPGTDGRPPGPMDTGPSRPGERIDPWAIGAGRDSPGQLVVTAGPRTQAGVVWESWSNPRKRGPGAKSPMTAGRTRGRLEQSPNHVLAAVGWTISPGRICPGSMLTRGQPDVPADSDRCLRSCWVDQLSRQIRSRVRADPGLTRFPADSDLGLKSRGAVQLSRPTRSWVRSGTSSSSYPGPLCHVSELPRHGPAVPAVLDPAPRSCWVNQISQPTWSRDRALAGSTSSPADSDPRPSSCGVDHLSRLNRSRIHADAGSNICPG